MSQIYYHQEGNILLIKITILNNFPLLRNKLDQISRDSCESWFSECAVYSTCSDQSYIGVYVDTIEEIAFDRIDNFTELVKGYLIVVNFPAFQEIYNVCVSKSERGKGISKKIFEVVLRYSLVNLLWLGVFADNPYFDAAINTYIKLGFGHQKIVEITPGGFSPGKPFIELIYNKNDPLTERDKVKTLSLTKVLQGYINDICIKPFLLKFDNLIQFKNLLKLDVETSGSIEFEAMTDILNIVEPVIYGGSEGVSSPQGNITFHTHPALCYTNNFCYIGWPSGQDMRFIYEQYVSHNLVLHFVVTVEGIYSVQLTIEFMNYIRKYDIKGKYQKECLNPIAKVIYAKFTPLEQLRNVKLTFPELYEIVIRSSNRDLLLIPTVKHDYMKTAFVNTVNNYTFNNLIEDIYSIEEEFTCSPENEIGDFCLFRLGFRSWSELQLGNINGNILSFECI